MREQNILGIKNLDAPIYRFFTVKRLRQVFAEKALTLVKPESWKDPFENFLLGSAVRLSTGELVSMNGIARKLYGQCWTLLRESDALWQIYAPRCNGVRVRTTVRKLWQTFYNPKISFPELNFWMGRIEYVSERSIRQFMAGDHAFSVALDSTGRGQALSLLVKRFAFRHEQEVRLIYNDTEEKQSGGLFRASIDPLTLFDEMVFDPRMLPARTARLKNEFQKRGFVGKITTSSLYQRPSFILAGS
ncbi:MAG TPA: hypothetical protein VGM54_02015 [Chthoniobacter sp.]|jgi:hypothetical protein